MSGAEDQEVMNAALRAELASIQAHASDQHDLIQALLNERSERRGTFVLFVVAPACLVLGMLIGFAVAVEFLP